jgi:hypothetical protein
LSIKQLARSDSALPLGPNTFYEGDEVDWLHHYTVHLAAVVYITNNECIMHQVGCNYMG